MGKHKVYKFKKELDLSNKEIAEFFDMSEKGFANSSAKDRYLQALSRFYDCVKSKREVKKEVELRLAKNIDYYKRTSC